MTDRPTNADVFDAVYAWAEANYPGWRHATIVLETSDGRQVRLPVPPHWKARLRVAGRVSAAVSTVSADAEEPADDGRAHSPDFRSVCWDGERYSFTPKQARVVELLWEAWKEGTPDLGQDYLLRSCESDGTRLIDLFRRNPAWGRLIIAGDSAGTFRLVDRP